MNRKMQIIVPKDVFDPRPVHYYSQAVKVSDTIYISGQVAWDEKGNIVGLGDMEAQTRQSLENLRRTVEAAGAKMSDIVKLIVFVRDIRDFSIPAVRKAWRHYFGDSFPALTVIQISNLWRPDFMLSIEGVAEIGLKAADRTPKRF